MHTKNSKECFCHSSKNDKKEKLYQGKKIIILKEKKKTKNNNSNPHLHAGYVNHKTSHSALVMSIKC